MLNLCVLAVVVMLAGSVAAAPRERPKDKQPAIVKMLKSIVRTLGDGLTIPTP
ncbi:MAG TPA: hypothetical protein VND45_17450 [Thermoanaerobaculia bacterium]|jgi:hypothetical protein|nr:hypothetical protein [Thermoanaerobaculia bacterium]